MAIGLVLLAVVSRIIGEATHSYNFAPVVAIGLVSGMLVKDTKTAVLLALLGQFLADVYFQIFPTATNTGFYDFSQFFVYGGLIAVAFIGKSFSKINLITIASGTLAASVAFYIISNFGYFLLGHNGFSVSGFIKTYIDAIPFFRNNLEGNFIGSAVLFGAYFTMKFLAPVKLKQA